MTPKQRILLRFALVLVAAIPLVWWDPGDIIPDGLRDNLVAEFVGALITLLFVERALDAVERRQERSREERLREDVLGMLDADLHALWALMREPAGRDDPIRRAGREARIARFLRDLEDDATWESAPSGHAAAVRGRIRDLGEDADRLLGLAASAQVDARDWLDALRVGCRELDETWGATPRGQLARAFRERAARPARALVEALPRA